MSVFIPNSTNRRLSTAYASSATQDFTISFWAKLTGTTPLVNRSFFSIEPNFTITTATDGITLAIDTSSATYNGSLLNADEWFNITTTVVSTSTTSHLFNVYLNGILNITANDTSTFSNVTGFTVGNSTTQGSNTFRLNGNVQNLLVFDRILTISEIQLIKNYRYKNIPNLLINSPFYDSLTKDINDRNFTWTVTGTGVVLGHGFVIPYDIT